MLKLSLSIKIISISILIGAFFLVLGLFLLPLISTEFKVAFLVGGYFLVIFLLASYLTFIAAAIYLSLLIKKSLRYILAAVKKMGEGALDEEIDKKLPGEFGETRLALENLRRILKERINTSEEAKDRAEAILFNVGEGVFAVNLRGEIIIFNQMAEKIIGFNEKQVLGQTYSQVLQFCSVKTKASYGSFIDQVLLEGKSVSLPAETVLVTSSRAEIPVAVNSSPIRNQKGIIVGGIVVFRDISHEKEIEEIRTDLISIASHQLRTPLSEIKGLLSLLLDNIAGPLLPRQKEYLDLLSVANERMINLVNDLLNISRIEQGRIQLNFKPVNLGALAQEVVKSLEMKAKERKQFFTLTVDPNLPAVIADAGKTKEIISNLIENALKYTFENGTIQVRVTDSHEGIWVLVKDNGVGIPKNKLKDLFQKFSRIENPLSKMTTGTGLGLYAVKQLVERQNGQVWVETTEGKGSTFGFVLPTAK